MKVKRVFGTVLALFLAVSMIAPQLTVLAGEAVPVESEEGQEDEAVELLLAGQPGEGADETPNDEAAGDPDAAPEGGESGDTDVTPEGGEGGDTDVTPEGGEGGNTDVTPEGGEGGNTDVTPEGGEGGNTDVTPEGGEGGDTDVTPEGGEGGNTDVTPEGGEGGDTDVTPEEGEGGDTDVTPEEEAQEGDVTPDPDQQEELSETPEELLADDKAPDGEPTYVIEYYQYGDIPVTYDTINGKNGDVSYTQSTNTITIQRYTVRPTYSHYFDVRAELYAHNPHYSRNFHLRVKDADAPDDEFIIDKVVRQEARTYENDDVEISELWLDGGHTYYVDCFVSEPEPNPYWHYGWPDYDPDYIETPPDKLVDALIRVQVNFSKAQHTHDFSEEGGWCACGFSRRFLFLQYFSNNYAVLFNVDGSPVNYLAMQSTVIEYYDAAGNQVGSTSYPDFAFYYNNAINFNADSDGYAIVRLTPKDTRLQPLSFKLYIDPDTMVPTAEVLPDSAGSAETINSVEFRRESRDSKGLYPSLYFWKSKEELASLFGPMGAPDEYLESLSGREVALHDFGRYDGNHDYSIDYAILMPYTLELDFEKEPLDPVEEAEQGINGGVPLKIESLNITQSSVTEGENGSCTITAEGTLSRPLFAGENNPSRKAVEELAASMVTRDGEVIAEVDEDGNFTVTMTGAPLIGTFAVTARETKKAYNYDTAGIPFLRVPVKKIWGDEATVDHSKDTVTVTLYTVDADGTQTSTGRSLTLNAGNEWSNTFYGAPLYTSWKRGEEPEEITYVVKETEINGYKVTEDNEEDDDNLLDGGEIEDASRGFTSSAILLNDQARTALTVVERDGQKVIDVVDYNPNDANQKWTTVDYVYPQVPTAAGGLVDYPVKLIRHDKTGLYLGITTGGPCLIELQNLNNDFNDTSGSPIGHWQELACFRGSGTGSYTIMSVGGYVQTGGGMISQMSTNPSLQRLTLRWYGNSGRTGWSTLAASLSGSSLSMVSIHTSGKKGLIYSVQNDPVAEITVTKKVVDSESGEEWPLENDETFYVGLFKDAQMTSLVEGTQIQELVVAAGQSSSNSVKFEKLEPGTYYIAETNANGKVLQNGTLISGEEFSPSYPDGQSAEISLQNPGNLTIANRVLKSEPVTGGITIRKELRVKGSKESYKPKNATFYVALFADEARTLRVTGVKKLRFRGTDSESVTFDNLEPGTYYLGETSSDGTLIVGGTLEDGRHYTVSYIDGTSASVSEEGIGVTRVFRNVFDPEDVPPPPPPRYHDPDPDPDPPKAPPTRDPEVPVPGIPGVLGATRRTGDNSMMNTWGAVSIISAALLGILLFIRRRRFFRKT